jgi:hypothetical protein
MSTLKSTLLLGLLLLANACSVGTVTASSGLSNGLGSGTSLGPIHDANSPANVEAAAFEHTNVDGHVHGPRESAMFRIESGCKRCR